MLLSPMTPVSVSVNGPSALFSRMTMSVEAAPVSTAIAPSRSATGQGCPMRSMPPPTATAASSDSVSVSVKTRLPMRRMRENSKTPPIENRMSPSPTSLKTWSACRFSCDTSPSTEGPTSMPATR